MDCLTCRIKNVRWHCGHCKHAHYCSRKCQAQHWPQHKANCAPKQALQPCSAPKATDREFLKLANAARGRVQRRHGFEGCVNCSYAGAYGINYSPEGLCSKCEKIYYPDRYNGCTFCRVARDKRCFPQSIFFLSGSRACMNCENSFHLWIYNMLHGESFAPKTATIYGVDLPDLPTYVSSGASLVSDVTTDFAFLPDHDVHWPREHKWPGFYCGQHKWHIPQKAHFDF